MTNTENNVTKTGWFDPEKSFLELKIVRISLVIIAAATALLVLVIAVVENLPFDLHSDGFNHALTMFKVPIALLTISIPVLALLAANHRSEQTKRQMELTLSQINRTDKQIELTNGQNTFSNYYKHLEEFDTLCTNLRGRFEVEAKHKLHGIIFPNARKGDLSSDALTKVRLEYIVATFIKDCEEMQSDIRWPYGGHRIFEGHRAAMAYYKFRHVGPLSGSDVTAGKDVFLFFGGNPRAFIEFHLSVITFIDDLLGFDDGYESPIVLTQLKKIRLDLISDLPISSAAYVPFNIALLLADG